MVNLTKLSLENLLRNQWLPINGCQSMITHESMIKRERERWKSLFNQYCLLFGFHWKTSPAPPLMDFSMGSPPNSKKPACLWKSIGMYVSNECTYMYIYMHVHLQMHTRQCYAPKLFPHFFLWLPFLVSLFHVCCRQWMPLLPCPHENPDRCGVIVC